MKRKDWDACIHDTRSCLILILTREITCEREMLCTKNIVFLKHEPSLSFYILKMGEDKSMGRWKSCGRGMISGLAWLWLQNGSRIEDQDLQSPTNSNLSILSQSFSSFSFERSIVSSRLFSITQPSVTPHTQTQLSLFTETESIGNRRNEGWLDSYSELKISSDSDPLPNAHTSSSLLLHHLLLIHTDWSVDVVEPINLKRFER
jgi:hypothetical protein